MYLGWWPFCNKPEPEVFQYLFYNLFLFYKGDNLHGTAVRKQIAIKLVEDYGFSLAETARQSGVTTPAISISLNNAGSL